MMCGQLSLQNNCMASSSYLFIRVVRTHLFYHLVFRYQIMRLSINHMRTEWWEKTIIISMTILKIIFLMARWLPHTMAAILVYCDEWNSTKLHCVHFNAISPFLEEHIPRHDSICAVFKWNTDLGLAVSYCCWSRNGVENV